MKIQLDTIAKTIKIEEVVNLGVFIRTLKALLPNGLWKEFKIEVGIITYYSSPITIVNPYTPSVPYPYPWITYSDPYTPDTLQQGTYCLDVQV